MEPKVKTIRLFDYKKDLLLSERTAGAVLAFATFSGELEENGANAIYRAAVILEDALIINIKKLKWYQFITKFRFKKMLNKKYIIDNLTASQISDLAREVLVLEGFKFDEVKAPENKKKVK